MPAHYSDICVTRHVLTHPELRGKWKIECLLCGFGNWYISPFNARGIHRERESHIIITDLKFGALTEAPSRRAACELP